MPPHLLPGKQGHDMNQRRKYLLEVVDCSNKVSEVLNRI